MKAARTTQLKTLRKEDSRTATESVKHDGMRGFQVREKELKGLCGRVQ